MLPRGETRNFGIRDKPRQGGRIVGATSKVYNYLHAMHYTLTTSYTDFTLYTLNFICKIKDLLQAVETLLKSNNAMGERVAQLEKMVKDYEDL